MLPDGSFSQVSQPIEEVLRSNDRDVPMGLLYSIDMEKQPTRQILRLETSIGVQKLLHWIPNGADLMKSNGGIVSLLRSVQHKKTLSVLRREDGTLQSYVASLMETVEWSGFKEPSKIIVIALLISAGNVLGFFILGFNPRKEFTEICQQFITDLSSQIASKWASAVTVDQAKKRRTPGSRFTDQGATYPIYGRDSTRGLSTSQGMSHG